MRLVLRLIANAIALWCAARFIDGIVYTGNWPGLLGLSLVFGVVNTLVRPVLALLSFPIQLLTLGLFTLVLNALMLWLTAASAARFGIDFTVSGFRAALLGSLLVSVVSTVVGWIIVPDGSDDD